MVSYPRTGNVNHLMPQQMGKFRFGFHFGLNNSRFSRGEGVVAVVLKPLSTALADGDRIYGNVRASFASPSLDLFLDIRNCC